MANKRHKPEEIVQKLRQVDVLVGQGVVRTVISSTSELRAGPQASFLHCVNSLNRP